MSSTKAEEQYSTNPSTIKARRRKMKLDGADKVEDAAKTADYKSMVYARKVVQSKPEYQNATSAEKSDMLERAMHDTMEKRRARGQDTLSKMAAFRAGEYSLRSGTTGPSTNVPISRFLVSHGYIPESTSRSTSGDAEVADGIDARQSTSGLSDVSSDFSFNTVPTAPMTTMEEIKSWPANFEPIVAKREASAPIQSINDLMVIQGPSKRSRTQQGTDISLSDRSPDSGVEFDPRLSTAQISPGNGSSGEIMLPSIEENSHSDEVAILRLEVAQLRNMFQHAMTSHNTCNMGDQQKSQDVHFDMADDRSKMTNLKKRLVQMEEMMYTMQYTSLPDTMKRIEELERAVNGMKAGAGEGSEEEIAKMKEVFGGFKESLNRMGDLFASRP